MASAGRGTVVPVTVNVTGHSGEPGWASLGNGGLRESLFQEPYKFSFFQAVRLLGRLFPERQPVGHGGSPAGEVVRFRARLSLSFPPSEIYDLECLRSPLGYELQAQPVPVQTSEDSQLVLTVAFMGLTGPKGVLPRHYTDLLLRLDHARDRDFPEKHALRAWLDLFNHRLISLFFRAWEKYRFFLGYERKRPTGSGLDTFLQALFSFTGLGTPNLQGRLRVEAGRSRSGPTAAPLARIDDLALLQYAGFLAQRHRCAVSLQALLENFFRVPVKIEQFRGQWLYLDKSRQSSLQREPGNNQLGVSTVVGSKVWDLQSKFRVRLGPLCYEEFKAFLPDATPETSRKRFFLLCQLVRLYVGLELDFDVQLVLVARDVPVCRLTTTDRTFPRVGWNLWIGNRSGKGDAEDVIFEADERTWLASSGR